MAHLTAAGEQGLERQGYRRRRRARAGIRSPAFERRGPGLVPFARSGCSTLQSLQPISSQRGRSCGRCSPTVSGTISAADGGTRIRTSSSWAWSGWNIEDSIRCRRKRRAIRECARPAPTRAAIRAARSVPPASGLPAAWPRRQMLRRSGRDELEQVRGDLVEAPAGAVGFRPGWGRHAAGGALADHRAAVRRDRLRLSDEDLLLRGGLQTEPRSAASLREVVGAPPTRPRFRAGSYDRVDCRRCSPPL